MESLFKRHDAYLSKVPMEYIRDFMQHIILGKREQRQVLFGQK